MPLILHMAGLIQIMRLEKKGLSLFRTSGEIYMATSCEKAIMGAFRHLNISPRRKKEGFNII
jgi:hypothetical protein